MLSVFSYFSYLVFLLIARESFPNSDQLINAFSRLYGRFGYEIIGVAAFIEALVLVNLFAPGGIALALGVVFARSGETDLFLVILSGALGAFCGYLIDYALGYFGFSQVLRKTGYEEVLNQAGLKLKSGGRKGLIIGFIHANIGSFASVAAGTIGFKFKQFVIIAFIATLFWSTLWGLAIYAIGDVFLTILRKYGFLMVLFLIGGIFLSKMWKEKS